MTEKTVVDMVSMITVLSMLEDAKNASSNDTISHPKWDQAAAYYIGASGKQRGTTYARADFRGQNYGTIGASGESSVNTKIINALNAGGGSSSGCQKKKVPLCFNFQSPIIKPFLFSNCIYASSTLSRAPLPLDTRST